MNDKSTELDLSAEAQTILETTHRFAEDVMRPAGIELDQMPDPADVIADGSVLWEVHEKYRQLGVNQLSSIGGFEPDEIVLLATLVNEELGWGDSGLAISLSVAGFTRFFTYLTDDTELTERFAGPGSTTIGCWAITEPDHGSDAVCLTEPSFHDPAVRPGCIAQRHGDGIILLGASIPFDCSPLRKSPDPGWPPMVIGCEFFDDFKLPTVRIDNIKAAQDATDHLLELGHRRIAYLNGPKDSPLCKDRFQGYKLSLRKAKLRYDITLLGQGDYSLHSGVKTMKRFLALDVPPTAVFAANDEMAIGAIKAAKEAGLEVPDDLSVAGFDDIRFAEFTDPALTTIHQPRISIGQQVMEVMCKLLRGEKLQDYVTVLPHELVVRESTCLPRRDG